MNDAMDRKNLPTVEKDSQEKQNPPNNTNPNAINSTATDLNTINPDAITPDVITPNAISAKKLEEAEKKVELNHKDFVGLHYSDEVKISYEQHQTPSHADDNDTDDDKDDDTDDDNAVSHDEIEMEKITTANNAGDFQSSTSRRFGDEISTPPSPSSSEGRGAGEKKRSRFERMFGGIFDGDKKWKWIISFTFVIGAVYGALIPALFTPNVAKENSGPSIPFMTESKFEDYLKEHYQLKLSQVAEVPQLVKFAKLMQKENRKLHRENNKLRKLLDLSKIDDSKLKDVMGN